MTALADGRVVSGGDEGRVLVSRTPGPARPAPSARAPPYRDFFVPMFLMGLTLGGEVLDLDDVLPGFATAVAELQL